MVGESKDAVAVKQEKRESSGESLPGKDSAESFMMNEVLNSFRFNSARQNDKSSFVPDLEIVRSHEIDQNPLQNKPAADAHRSEGDQSNHQDKGAMTEKQLGELAKGIAEKLAENPKNLGDKFDLMKQMQQAEKGGQLELLIGKINEDLAKTGSGVSLDLNITQRQSPVEPELEPYSTWNRYNIDLKASNGDVLDCAGFNDEVIHHQGLTEQHHLPGLE